MPFRTLMRYRNPDITSDVNRRLRDLVQKGVFFGGDVIPIAGQLNVQIGNLGAVGADGMVTLLEGVPETAAVQAGFAQWVLLHAVYVANDDSIAELEVLTETEYNALTDAEKDERIRLAKVTLSVVATEVTTADISFTEADLVDPVARSKFRGSVSTDTALPDWADPPSGVSTTNRVGDVYFVEDDRVFFSWTSSGWRAVVGTAEAIELTNHKNNEDDGTLAPDFFNAQHLLVKHRECLDAGTASLVQYSTLGFDFGSGNPLVDANYPLAIMRRSDFVGLSGATRIPLIGEFYVGTDAVGTANAHFKLSSYQNDRQLIGTDRRLITVLRVLTSDGLTELTPSSHADDYGFYTDPIIEMDLSATTDVAYSGNLSVFGNVKRTVGTLTLDDFSIAQNGLGFTRTAEDVPVIGANFGTISSSIDDVQQALDAIDNELGTQASLDQDVKDAIARIQNGAVYTAHPDALSWYGGTGSAIGLLDDDASNNPRLRAVATDFIYQVPTGRTFDWVVNTTTEMQLSASLLRLTSALNVGGSTGLSTGDGVFTRGLNVGTDAAPTDNDIYARGGGLNAGGNVNPGSGHGIFTTGIHVGSDTAPNSNQVTVGDSAKTFGLSWDGTDGRVQFDANDQLIYDRSANDYLFQIANATEMLVSTDGVRVANGLHVGDTSTAPTDNNVSVVGTIAAGGNISAAAFVFGALADDDKIEFNDTSDEMTFRIDNVARLIVNATGIDLQSGSISGLNALGCATVTATNYVSATNHLEAPVWRLDADDYATFVNGTSWTVTIGSSDRIAVDTNGFHIADGLHVGNMSTAPTDNDITLDGGINAGGSTDPAAGDGIFIGGLRVGSDAAATPGDIIASGGITVGGITNPGDGDGIFVNALRIGGDSAPATKLQIFTSAVGSFPAGSDVVVEKNGDSYFSFMASGEAGIIVGDASVNNIGQFIYDHTTDTWNMTAAGQLGFVLAETTLVVDRGRTAIGDSAATDNSAALKVQSTTRGFLPPRMTTTEKNNISTPTVGLIVFDTTLNSLQLYDGAWKTVTTS